MNIQERASTNVTEINPFRAARLWQMPSALVIRTLKKLNHRSARKPPRALSVAGSEKALTPTNACVLPTVVCEMVIDCVADCMRCYGNLWSEVAIAATLRACSLTCREWTARSQYHLFRFITVRCSRKQVQSVIALLNKNPALQSRIEVLVLKSPGRLLPILNSIPLQLAEALPHVPQLRISHSLVDPASKSNMHTTLNKFTSVTTLNIFSSTFPSFNDLRYVIRSLSQIQALVLDMPRWVATTSKTIPRHQVEYPTTVRLKELYLNADASWLQDLRGLAFFEWLALSGAAFSLEKLMMANTTVMNDAACAAIKGVVEASSKTLQQLIIHVGPDTDYLSLCPAISRCSKLIVLALCVPYHVSAFRHLVSFLSSPLITTSSLIIRFNEFPLENALPGESDWKDLDSVLQGPNWAALSFLLVCRVPKIAPEDFTWGRVYQDKPFVASTVREQLLKDMPLSYKRGIMYQLHGLDGKGVSRI